MARTRKIAPQDIEQNKEEVVSDVEQQKEEMVSDLIDVSCDKYNVLYLPENDFVEFKNGKATVNKKQYEALKDMGVI